MIRLNINYYLLNNIMHAIKTSTKFNKKKTQKIKTTFTNAEKALMWDAFDADIVKNLKLNYLTQIYVIFVIMYYKYLKMVYLFVPMIIVV